MRDRFGSCSNLAGIIVQKPDNMFQVVGAIAIVGIKFTY
jgi:hypothetical protein